MNKDKMLIQKRNLYKRKVIGGSIFGNLFNSTKNLLTTGSKLAMKNASQQASNLLKSTNVRNLVKQQLSGKALLDAAKSQLGVSNFDDLKNLALAQATQKANQIGEDLAKKVLTKRVPLAIKETINQLASNPQAKKALTKKSKQLIKSLVNQASMSDNSRAMMSNIIAGSGIQKIR